MIYCYECGSAVADIDIYCSYCGISLQEAKLAHAEEQKASSSHNAGEIPADEAKPIDPIPAPAGSPFSIDDKEISPTAKTENVSLGEFDIATPDSIAGVSDEVPEAPDVLSGVAKKKGPSKKAKDDSGDLSEENFDAEFDKIIEEKASGPLAEAPDPSIPSLDKEEMKADAFEATIPYTPIEAEALGIDKAGSGEIIEETPAAEIAPELEESAEEDDVKGISGISEEGAAEETPENAKLEEPEGLSIFADEKEAEEEITPIAAADGISEEPAEEESPEPEAPESEEPEMAAEAEADTSEEAEAKEESPEEEMAAEPAEEIPASEDIAEEIAPANLEEETALESPEDIKSEEILAAEEITEEIQPANQEETALESSEDLAGEEPVSEEAAEEIAAEEAQEPIEEALPAESSEEEPAPEETLGEDKALEAAGEEEPALEETLGEDKAMEADGEEAPALEEASAEPALETTGADEEDVEAKGLAEPASEEALSEGEAPSIADAAIPAAIGAAAALPLMGMDELEAAEKQSETSEVGQGIDTGGGKQKLKPLIEGTVLAQRYEIVRKIGGGGMGAVYLASDRNLGGVLRAVKEMVQSHIEEEEQEKAVSDFKRESMLLTSLDHPSIPTIYDYFYDEPEGRFYLVMKYISGGDLAARLRSAPENRIDEKTVTEWAIQVADVLDYLHNHEPPIVYRDLKPSNVMIDGNSGRVMLIDFGIARWVTHKEEKGVTAVGTMGYAPPELFSGNVEPRSDIYSLGSTMFHLLTGADPQNSPLLIFDFNKNPKPRQINSMISDQMEQILMRAVEYDAANRFASCSDMREVLIQHLESARVGKLTFGVNDGISAVGLAGNQYVFCGFCGQKIVTSDMFCPFCGAKQPSAGMMQASPIPQSVFHPASVTAKLVMISTTELDKPVYSLEKENNLIGRRDPMSNIFPEVDLSKYDPQTKISRRHARIWREGDSFMVEDLGSSNGTILFTSFNEQMRLLPHQPRMVAHGDKIKIGDTTLHFMVG